MQNSAAVRIAGYIHKQVSEHAVDNPRGLCAVRGKLGKGGFQFVDGFVTGFVSARRLTGRTDKQSGKQVGERWTIIPISDQATKHIGAAEERTFARRRTAQHQVITTARAGMPAIEHEFFRAQAGLSGFFVECRGIVNQLVPFAGRLQIYFDDAGVGRDFERLQSVIVRRRVAFDSHGHRQFFGGELDSVD